MNYRIFPPDEMIDATIELPLSKSVAARQMIINVLTHGAKPLPDSVIPDADDSLRLREGVAMLAESPRGLKIDVGAGGTTLRFMTALCAVTEGADVVLDGSERLRQRPISVLVDALNALGADVTYEGKEGCAPLHIRGRRLKGGRLTVDPTVSSQFVSALMMVAPTMTEGLTIDFGECEPVSRPYISMTARQMERAGIEVEVNPFDIVIKPASYRPVEPYAERDWSAASYWYALSAVSAGFITLPGLSVNSIQGDARIAEYFRRLGVDTVASDEVEEALQLTPNPDQHARFEQDMSDTPDLAQTVAVTAALLGIPFHLTGLSTLRHKESDRLEGLRSQLDKFGIIVELRGDDQIVWNGERHPLISMPEVETFDDHRMAMSFAPAAVYLPGMVIDDIEVVDKSYPRYWDDLRAAGFMLTDASVPLPDPEEGDDD